jgi:hypothetical protein
MDYKLNILDFIVNVHWLLEESETGQFPQLEARVYLSDQDRNDQIISQINAKRSRRQRPITEIGLIELVKRPYVWRGHKSDIMLSSFYNYAASLDSHNLPRGFMGKILCAVLENEVSAGRLELNEIIALEASGKLRNLPYEKLVKYYKDSFGFQVIPGGKPNDVKMLASVKRVMAFCSGENLPDELLEELEPPKKPQTFTIPLDSEKLQPNLDCSVYDVRIMTSKDFYNILESISSAKFSRDDVARYKNMVRLPRKYKSFPDIFYKILIELHTSCQKKLNPDYLASAAIELYNGDESTLWFIIFKPNILLAFAKVTYLSEKFINEAKIEQQEEDGIGKLIIDTWKTPLVLGVLCSSIKGGGSCLIQKITNVVKQVGSNILLVDKPVENEETFYLNRGFIKLPEITEWYGFWGKYIQ